MTATKTTQRIKFAYGNSYKIIHWGFCFDSLLEIKFALSIQDDFEFLRTRITIIYDRKTKLPVQYALRKHGHYTPDFLIRHKQSNKAYWVEIKPRAYADGSKLDVRREVAENYIRHHQYDWQYRIVRDDEIILSLDQLSQFNECCKLIHKPRVQNENISLPSFFGTSHRQNLAEWIIFGTEKYRRIAL